ncbi:ATP synthase delta subunit-domain-containing protein [Ustulina deusta]|nr:ATP synthase delta subunit-domain-containing protein [Ustulina deusta]
MLSRQALRSLRAAAPQRTFARSAVRSYAAPAATQDVKPPVAVYGVGGTYATALYTAAVKTSTLDPTARALTALGNLYAKDAKLATVLATPTLTDADKSIIVAELQKSIGAAGANETVKNFLAALAENNRLALLKDVCDKFAELISASRGEVEMVVTSTQLLDSKTLARLETAVSKSQYVGQGKKLTVTNKVNPDILGGLVVEIGDRTIDLSVSSKIAKMNKLLTDTL